MKFSRLLLATGLLLSAFSATAEEPNWIWSATKAKSSNEIVYFRQTFVVKEKPAKALLSADADDKGEFYLNGKKVATVADWSTASYADVGKYLVKGKNVLAVRCENKVGAAGMILNLEMTVSNSGKTPAKGKANAGLRRVVNIVTSTNWRYSEQDMPQWAEADFNDEAWQQPKSLGKVGVEPWGKVFTARQATTADTLQVMPGFKVELLHSADQTEGSWISMVADPKGRLIISPQGDESLLRLTISQGRIAKTEHINQPVHTAMGLLYTDGALYVNGKGPKEGGIYKLNAHGDKFDAPILIRPMKGEGEHGSHGLVLGPDKKIYVVSGNFTEVPSNISPNSPLHNFADDQLLPRANDGRGFGNGRIPPGGFVLRMDLNGSNAQLFAGGLRNTYDIAFNPAGELFGFDSDMEWDWGAAWYRPTRVNHLVSGGNYGFREGSGKFPEYYQDTLPANLNIGLGSPTGVLFPTEAKFPKKYRDAFFMQDWAYGRLFAVYLTPNGASYDATYDTIVRGSPLNLTAMAVGKDGALYFITGGRGTESGLYRLTYTGPSLKSPKPTRGERMLADQAEAARHLRHEFEAFEGKHDPRIIEAVWPSLSNNDRWLRYAARTALEFQDVNLWKSRALAETNLMGGLTALLALTRCGSTDIQNDLLLALKKFPLDSLNEEMQLLKLRVIELSFIRQGRPSPELAQLAIEKLNPHYPAKSEALNRELCQILLYLQAPGAVSNTLNLLGKAPTLEEQTIYTLHLRNITNGWTMEDRRRYLEWFGKDHDDAKHPPAFLKYFSDVNRDYADGASLSMFFTNLMTDTTATLSAQEKEELADLLPVATNATPTNLVKHPTVKEWRMQDIEPDLDRVKTNRSFNKGKTAFADAQCILCHHFGRTGGSVGPDLTAVASRLTARDILESIILPSKVVSEQYQNTIVSTKDGEDYIGRIVEETPQKLTVMTDPIKLTKVDVKKSDVAGKRQSKVSPMPEGLVNFLTEDQILDLIAYLQSGGKRTSLAFKK